MDHHRHATPPPKPYLVSLEAVIGGVLRDSLIDAADSFGIMRKIHCIKSP